MHRYLALADIANEIGTRVVQSNLLGANSRLKEPLSMIGR